MRYKQACVYGVTESRGIRGTELYRQQKTLLRACVRYFTNADRKKRSIQLEITVRQAKHDS